MPEYRNPSTGVVVRVSKETGDRLVGFEPVTPTTEGQAEKPPQKRATRRKKS